MALWPPAICVCWMHIWCIKAHQKYISAECCIQGICVLSVDCTISLSLLLCQVYIESYVYGLVREGRGSIADALGLRLSCTSPSVCFSIRTEDGHSTGNQPFLSLYYVCVTLTSGVKNIHQCPVCDSGISTRANTCLHGETTAPY